MQMIDYGKVETGPQIPTPMDSALARQQRQLDRQSQGLGDLPGVAQLATAAVKGVTFKSTVTPDYTYDPNAESRPGGMGDLIMRWLKPTMEVQTPAGPMVYAPYGQPSFNVFPLLMVGTVAAMAGGAYLIYRGAIK